MSIPEHCEIALQVNPNKTVFCIKLMIAADAVKFYRYCYSLSTNNWVCSTDSICLVHLVSICLSEIITLYQNQLWLFLTFLDYLWDFHIINGMILITILKTSLPWKLDFYSNILDFKSLKCNELTISNKTQHGENRTKLTKWVKLIRG